MIKKNKLYKKRLEILEYAKKNIIFDGWNNKIFESVSLDMKVSDSEIKVFFSNDFINLLKFYIDHSENNFIETISKIDLSEMSTQEKVYYLIKFYFEQNIKDKELIRRTFNILILPQNLILGIKTLYKLVDNIWYLAGDKSTDYNYYTKRSILASIYIITLIRWLNDESKNLNKTEKLIKKLLNKTSYIPKIKNKLNLFINRTLGNNKFNN